MPIIQIQYETEEELCRLLRTTLQKLPNCERLPSGPGLVQQLKRSSRGLQTVSISAPGTVPSAPPDQSPTFRTPTSFSIEDPDNPFQLIEVPLAGFPPLPPAFEPEVTVVDDKGKVTRQRKVPLDLKLIESLTAGKDTALGDFVGNLSRVAATLLNTTDPTISESLARSGKTTVRAVHLGLLLPILKIAPKPVARSIGKFLKLESDISLLEGNLFDLQQQVKQLDKGFNIPLISTSTAIEKDVFKRIRGNLEIAIIEAQEEF